ncbi:hypothetical protein [cf. Phormidesmis sp. LEGE 11477]|uniref:hypothetical protein n=1 Tax=cf. Phormidesmis sp. LEGE 11477 TaxID=1828680 RepID=UPI00187F1063|nr:hypothetical protein [cf. Phormidesmis sp. LEGE 11477]MBE9065009.1 hypothetical protein [cf. Phormidesmis sp. LEGE 11477]
MSNLIASVNTVREARVLLPINHLTAITQLTYQSLKAGFCKKNIHACSDSAVGNRDSRAIMLISNPL